MIRVVSPLLLLASTPSFGWINWSIVILYLAGMVTIGHLTGRKKTDAEGYFLGQRSVPIFAVVLSTIAAMLSAATFIGVPQASFRGDLSYLVLNIGGFIAIVIVGTLFIPRFYRAGTITIYGFINQRLGERARIACSAMFIVGRILASGARLFIVAIPISKLIFNTAEHRPGLITVAVLIIGGMGIAYTVAGGIKAVIWTDTAQIFVVVGAAVMSIAMLLHEIPKPAGEIVYLLTQPDPALGHSKLRIVDTSWDWGLEFTLWVALFANMPLQLAAYGTDHDMAQRMLTARSPMRGGISAILAQVTSVAVVSLFLVIGLLLYVFYTRKDIMGYTPSDAGDLGPGVDVYPQYLTHHLPVGLAGMAIAGLFAVAQGSLDSAINAMASSLVADLYWPLRRLRGLPVDEGSARTPRLAVLLMGCVLILFAIGCAFAFDPKSSILIFALGIMAFANSGMLAVFLTALFTRRGSTRSVLGALAVGAAIVALFQPAVVARWTPALFGRAIKINTFWGMPIATGLAFLVCIAGKRRGAEDEMPEPRGFEVAAKRA